MVERSDTTGYEMVVKAAGTPAGVQDLMTRCRPVVSSLTLLNHRLLAAMPPASSRSKSVINGREEYNFPIWDGFSFRANGQRYYSPVRRAGKIFCTYDLLFDLKGRDCGPSGLNQTFAARKNRPFGPGCRITPLQVEI